MKSPPRQLAVVSRLKRFWCTSVQFGNVRIAFLPRLRGKRSNFLVISWPKRIKIGAKKFLKIAKVVSPWFHSKGF